MLQSILAFHHESNLFFQFPQSVLNLPKDTYEDYLAFLFENNEQLQSDNHTLYLQKAAFDSVIETFTDEELSILQEKEDMYMYYIMYSTFYVILYAKYKNMGKITHAEFVHSIADLFNFYTVTLDERLFIEKIEDIVKETLINRISPFSYLEACKELFSEKLQNKLTDILKFMMGDSFCYKMNPASIFGICIKWTVDRYKISNTVVNELILHLIDPTNEQIEQKISKLQQMMNEIMSIN